MEWVVEFETGHRVLDVGCGTGEDARYLAQVVGLVEITCVPHVVQIPFAIVGHLLEGALAAAQAAGAVSAEEQAHWWPFLEKAEAAGQCYIGQVGFMVKGTKP